MSTILLLEDEPELSRLIAEQLEQQGHTVVRTSYGELALQLLNQQPFDLVILDLMLPDLDGFEVCRRIRQQHIIPILMLTARSAEIDKVLGLELGADDYLTKPFSMRELLARVGAMLRRAEYLRQVSRIETPVAVRFGALEVDPTTHTVQIAGTPIHLTAREFEVLHLLASHPGRVFSRDYLIERIWGSEYTGGDRTVDTHIRRLRQKLDGPHGIAERIITLWGVGYKFDPQDDL